MEETMIARLDNFQSDFWQSFNADYFQQSFVCLFALQIFLQGRLIFD